MIGSQNINANKIPEDYLKSLIAKEAAKYAPREACGFILDNMGGKPQLMPCANLHPEPEHYFDTHPIDFVKAQQTGRLIAFYHTHPTTPAVFTFEDRECTQRVNLGHFVYSIPQNRLEYDPPRHKRSLEGRRFVLNAQDCITLFLDYYAQELSLRLPYVEHSLDDLSSRGLANWTDFLSAWQQVDSPCLHDLLLLNLNGQTAPNHVAVYLGNNLILHQMVHSASSRHYYGESLQRNTVRILRYRV